MGITHLCENAHFTYKILQHTCFNCTCYTCSYDKCVWDMSQYNKLSDIQYAKFQILPVDLHFGLFWSAGHVTMNKLPDIWYCKIDGATIIVHLCVSRTDNLIPNTNIGYKLVYLWYMEPTHSATQKPACVSTHSATVSHSYNSLVHVYPIIDPCGII